MKIQPGVHKALFETCFKDDDKKKVKRRAPLGLFPFPIRVILTYRRTPRHPSFEYTVDMGRGYIEKLFDTKEEIKGDLTFVFPERWMNVSEQRRFPGLLRKQKGITSVEIITHSPILIGEFDAATVRIAYFDDDVDLEKE